VLNVVEIKTVPYVPLSHPFVERLIGTITARVSGSAAIPDGGGPRRKTVAVQRLLQRISGSRIAKGQTPIETPASKGVDLKAYRWQKHCRGLYQTPTAA